MICFCHDKEAAHIAEELRRKCQCTNEIESCRCNK